MTTKTNDQVLTMGLRETLKTIMQNEIKKPTLKIKKQNQITVELQSNYSRIAIEKQSKSNRIIEQQIKITYNSNTAH